MLASPNPLVPAAYDLTWSAVSLVLAALAVVALVSIARSARSLTSAQALGWTLLAILVPLVGPLAWLFIGRRASAQRSAASRVRRRSSAGRGESVRRGG